MVHLINLIVPSEEGIEAAFERKKAKYAELAAEYREVGWKTTIYPVEVGCPGYVGLPTTRGRRSDWREAATGHKRSGRGGGERQLLALAEEERQ